MAGIGLAAMLLGALDPLEGSPAIVLGIGLVALAARRERRGATLAAVGFGMALFGFAAMWILTVLGGVGGSTGHSAWWALLALPLAPGWLLGVIVAIRLFLVRRPVRGAVSRSSDAFVPASADLPQDQVEESGLESFPASDPPSWWAGEDEAQSPTTPASS